MHAFVKPEVSVSTSPVGSRIYIDRCLHMEVSVDEAIPAQCSLESSVPWSRRCTLILVYSCLVYWDMERNFSYVFSMQILPCKNVSRMFRVGTPLHTNVLCLLLLFDAFTFSKCLWMSQKHSERFKMSLKEIILQFYPSLGGWHITSHWMQSR